VPASGSANLRYTAMAFRRRVVEIDLKFSATAPI
jgi:hypothetical protein